MPAVVCLCGGQSSQPSVLSVFPQWSRVFSDVFRNSGCSTAVAHRRASMLPIAAVEHLCASSYGSLFMQSLSGLGPLVVRHPCCVWFIVHPGLLLWTWTHVEHLAPCRCVPCGCFVAGP